MNTTLARHCVLIALAALVPTQVCAQTPAGRPKAAASELAVLDRPASFEISTKTGFLKETVQGGQELIWRAKENASDRRFQVDNISLAFLRSETGGSVKMNFSGNVSSLGYSVSEEVQLNVIVRSKGGAALHSWNFGVMVKCGDKNQPLTPVTHELPKDFAANVFTNVNTVEVSENTEPNFPGAKVERCRA